MDRMGIRNVLVTGGSGKIGQALLPKLVEAGYAVRAIQFERPIDARGVEVMEGNLRDTALGRRAVEDMDAVIHLANVKENREKFMAVNVRGTFELLDAARECGHIRQFVQAGSDARAGIYHYPRPVPIDETHPHSGYPGYYGLSKVLEETLCEQYRIQYGLPITVLRFSWVHTEDDILAHVTLAEPNFGVPVWEELAVTSEQRACFEGGADGVARLVHPGGKAGVRHIVGLPDVVAGVMLAMGNPTVVGEAFNISGPSPFSYDVLADYVSEKMGLPVVEFEYDGFHDFRIDITKSRSVLGYDPEYDIFRIVDDAIAFRKSGRKRTPMKYPG